MNHSPTPHSATQASAAQASATQTSVTLTWKDKLWAIFSSSRPISWINTAFPFGAAYLLVGGRLDWVFVVGVLFFLIPYNIAMYGINDVFDYESDIRNPRKGGVEGAVLDKRLHPTLLWASAITVVPLAIILYAAGTPASAFWLTVSLAAVLAYSAPVLRFKERPVLDSITSSTHFVTPALVGGTMAQGLLDSGEVTRQLGQTGPPYGLTPQFWIVMAAFFLWGMASHALGAVQDVQSDREGGLTSVATELGPRLTVRLAVGCYALASLLLLTLGWYGAIVAVANLLYVVNAARFWNVDDAGAVGVNRAWKVFLWANYVVGAVVTMTLIWLVIH